MSESVVPTFHMIGLTALLANRVMRFFRKDIGIGFPKIAIGVTPFVFIWNSLPQQFTSDFTAVTDHKSHDLPGAPTHGGPQPAFVCLFEHERPDFIQFEDIFGLGRGQSGFKSRVTLVFF